MGSGRGDLWLYKTSAASQLYPSIQPLLGGDTQEEDHHHPPNSISESKKEEEPGEGETDAPSRCQQVKVGDEESVRRRHSFKRH